AASAPNAPRYRARALPRLLRPRVGGPFLVGRFRPRRGARLRAGALRASALGALLVGHDGAAEGDGAGARRDSARALEGARAPVRREAGRPALLVHDHRL